MVDFPTIAIMCTVIGLLLTAGGLLVKSVMAINGRVDGVKSEAANLTSAAIAKTELVSAQFYDFKLHCAETFITRHDMAQALEPVMDSLKGIKHSVDNMALRVDRVVEGQNNAPARRRPAGE